jgi:hypothetical protein
MANYQSFIAYYKYLGLRVEDLLVLPIKQTSTRPTGPDLVQGLFHFNVDLGVVEWYDGATWIQPGAGSGYSDEQARDVIGAALTTTASITFTPNDGADTIIADVNPAYVKGLFSGGSGITYNSTTGAISSSITQYTDEQAQDAVGTILSSEFTYDDPGNAISINTIAATKITGTKTSTFISDFSTAVDARITLQKGAVNGITPLGADQKVPTIYLPATIINNVFVVGSQAAMLALAATQGDIAIRTDLNKSYALATNSPSTLADWKELLSPASVLSVNGLTGTVTVTTTNISEGTNLYYTDTRFDTRFALKTTDNLAEGTTNLYFTNERVDDRVAALLQNGTGISWAYNDAGNTLTPTITLAPFSTTNLAEGTNLYYTDARVQTVGDTRYIRNQNASGQTADFRITGVGRMETSAKTNFMESISGNSKIRLGRAGDIYMNVYFAGNFNRNMNFSVIGNTAYVQALGEAGSYWNNVVYGGYNDTGAQPHIDFGFGATGQHRFANTGNMLISTFTDNTVDKLQVNGTIMVSGLATSGSAPTTTGTLKMLITDQNGRFSFQNLPSAPSTPGLQEVTDVGNLTTNDLITNGHLAVRNSSSGFKGEILEGTTTLTANRQYRIPDATGTIALQEYVTAQGFAVATRNINTQHSLTGGGNLSADRTLNLVNDTATPGNNKLYGTDGTGARGWFAQPVGTVTSFGFTDGSGFAGSVSTATSTPSLSLTTSVASTRVLFANTGAMAGSANFVWNDSSSQLSITGQAAVSKTTTNVTSGNVSVFSANTSNWTSTVAQSSGAVYGSFFGLNQINVNVNGFTFDNGAIHSSSSNILRLGSTASAAGTVTQSGAFKRAVSANAIMVQLDNVSSSAIVSSITDVAAMQIFAPQAANGSGVASNLLMSIGNYYGILIGATDEYTNSSTNITNRYGIYQIGGGDTNVFASKKNNFGHTLTTTSAVDITGAHGYDQLRLRTAYTPTNTSDSNGSVGDFAWDDGFVYVKTNAGWKRSTLSTF